MPIDVKGDKIYSYVELKPDSDVEGLSMLEEALALIHLQSVKSGQDEIRQIKNERIYKEGELTLKADCSSFIDQCLEPIRSGKNTRVAISVDYRFVGVLGSVIKMSKYQRAYSVYAISWPNTQLPIKRNVKLYIKGK